MTKNILILTRDRQNASFRQRIKPYILPLKTRNIHCQVQQLEKSTLARIKQFKRAQSFDAVLLHRKTLNLTESFWAGKCCSNLIYDFDDAIFYRAHGTCEKPDRSRFRRFKRTAKLSRLIFAGNGLLQNQAARCQAAGSVVMVPTGLDTSRYTPKDYNSPQSGKVRLVWIGSKSTLKQVRSFSPMLTELAKSVDNIVLRIIADDGLDIPGLEIENLPWTRDTEARLLNESDIAIAPLPDTPFARGKCAFKVLQYMASALPTVTSPIGANAGYIEHEKTGFHATYNQQWISYIKKLALDQNLRRQMGTLARSEACSKFDFKALQDTFCDAIENLLNKNGTNDER